MAGELPVCRRFCFCLPLRYGLLAWGYIKLIFGLLLIVMFSSIVHQTITRQKAAMSGVSTEETELDQTSNFKDIVLPIIAIVIFVTDFVLSTIFIIGGHMKNLKLLRVFYFYSIVFWGMTLLLTFMRLYFFTKNIILSEDLEMRSRFYYFKHFPHNFVNLVIQTYFLILLKSEVMKLGNNCQFRFVNNAADSELTMRYGEEVKGGENGIEKSVEKETSNDKCELRGSINV